jgi:hypothetical protein
LQRFGYAIADLFMMKAGFVLIADRNVETEKEFRGGRQKRQASFTNFGSHKMNLSKSGGIRLTTFSQIRKQN